MDLLATLFSNGPEETHALGVELGRLLAPGHVVGLVGDLGAGKTCFAGGVAEGVGVGPEVYVSSPTFTLVNEYGGGRLTLFHIDFYRLSTPEDLVEIGVDEYYRGSGACLVEWFDRFPGEIPPGYLEVRFEVVSADRRRLRLGAQGETHSRLAQIWSRAWEGDSGQG